MCDVLAVTIGAVAVAERRSAQEVGCGAMAANTLVTVMAMLHGIVEYTERNQNEQEKGPLSFPNVRIILVGGQSIRKWQSVPTDTTTISECMDRPDICLHRVGIFHHLRGFGMAE
mmetsp:Transcript_4902/g.12310  ORF Transcript_4902/g.12310 Transcript_4902/m.12310 type:complete len:115 (+) Transcript_4902:616-960(+)